ncbi:MAG: hypothetical protein N3D11_01775 [Candidatus Sumerlaeia bacterium]|nr:hypothetical protein [Candidatus Sumerlaeia bacterium]
MCKDKLADCPRFNKPIQERLAALSKRCHEVVLSNTNALREAEGEIDELAARLWGITPVELRAMQETVAEMETRPQ